MLTYNANAVITRKVANEIKSLISSKIKSIQTEETNEEKINQIKDQKFDATMIKLGQEMQAKTESDYEAGINLLVATFCGCKVEDVENAPYKEFEEILNKIKTDQTELMGFLKMKEV